LAQFLLKARVVQRIMVDYVVWDASSRDIQNTLARAFPVAQKALVCPADAVWRDDDVIQF
jgi:hypothetical protein